MEPADWEGVMLWAVYARIGVVALLVVGCALMNLEQVRGQPPSSTAEIADRQYDALAGCVLEGLLQWKVYRITISASQLTYQTNRHPELERMTVTGFDANPGGQPIPMIDLTFVQRASTVLVESRLGGFVGRQRGSTASRLVNEQAWVIIERCAVAGSSMTAIYARTNRRR